jgi:hypothetical protein
MLHEAGFPVWFVLALGTLSLIQALRYRSGAPGSDVVGAVAATLFCGMAATIWGVRLSIDAVPSPPDATTQWLVVLGLKESIANLFIACFFGLGASLVATVGKRRSDIAPTV